MGVNPAPFSLRELFWMIDGYRELNGFLAAWSVSWIVKATAGEDVDPHVINPMRKTITVVKTAAQRKRETRLGFRALGLALGDSKLPQI